MSTFHYLWLIPLLPLAGFVLNGLLGARLGKKFVTVVGCGVVLLAFLPSAVSVWELSDQESLATMAVEEGSGLRVSAEHRRVELMVWEWFPSVDDGGSKPSLRIPWLLTLDSLSAVMLLVVKFVNQSKGWYEAGLSAP